MNKMADLLEELIRAAKEDNWNFVDKQIPKIAQNPQARKQAIGLLTSSDGNLRDLAASLLTKAKLTRKMIQKLGPKLKHMMLNDLNPYARYRAAFALAEHASQTYSQELIPILESAVRNKDVSIIASNYLEKVRVNNSVGQIL